MLSCFSHVWLLATLWTVAHQAPLWVGFSRQEYWSGLLCPPSGDLPNTGIKPMSLMSPKLAGRFFTTSTTWEAPKVKVLHAQFVGTLWDPMDCSPPGSSVHGILQGKHARVDCHSLLQGVFPTQGLNPSLAYCRQILYSLRHHVASLKAQW